MRLDPIGELTEEEIAELKDTVTIPIITYHYETGKPKTFEVEFRIIAPAGADLEVMDAMVNNSTPSKVILSYIRRSLTTKGKKQWQTLVDDDDYVLKPTTLGKVYRGLVGAHVNPVPTKPRAGSRRTTNTTKKTSARVAKAKPGRREALARS